LDISYNKESPIHKVNILSCCLVLLADYVLSQTTTSEEVMSDDS